MSDKLKLQLYFYSKDHMSSGQHVTATLFPALKLKPQKSIHTNVSVSLTSTRFLLFVVLHHSPALDSNHCCVSQGFVTNTEYAQGSVFITYDFF